MDAWRIIIGWLIVVLALAVLVAVVVFGLFAYWLTHDPDAEPDERHQNSG